MKITIFAFCCLLSTLVTAEVEKKLNYDWTNNPIGPAPQSSDQSGTRLPQECSVANRNQFPYQAGLILNGMGLCGGSIISSNWVLTAAQCVDIPTTHLQVVLGAHNPYHAVGEPTQVRLSAQAIIVHDQWNRESYSNNIALLRVDAIPIGQPGISVISLAPADSGNFAGSTARITGWGRTCDSHNSIALEVMYVDLPVITNAVCQATYGSVIQSEHICTSGAVGLGACGSDSGGPLVLNGAQIGIMYFGGDPCEVGFPRIFTRVAHFRSWIEVNSGI